jgi:hypothetical protein
MIAGRGWPSEATTSRPLQLDVEEDHVRRQRLDPLERLDAVLRLADHLDVRPLGKNLAQPGAGRGFVVDDQRPQRHAVLRRLSTVTSS